MTLLAAILLFALTRAEIIERMRAPVVTYSEGLVQVYADCPEDMRREFQTPIARFAADTIRILYEGQAMKPVRFRKPGIIVHVGDVRTNRTDVVVKVSTNEAHVVSRLYLKSPAHADVGRFRLEIVKAFCRCVKHEELDDAAAVELYRKADPRFRMWDERRGLERWLAGEDGDDELNLKRMLKVFEPGKAAPRDILIFASRLYLYPPFYDQSFAGGVKCVDFRTAAKGAAADPRIRLVAATRANEMVMFGGGKGETLAVAADLYRQFLLELAGGEKGEAELLAILDEADLKLAMAFDEACKRTD